MKSVEKEKVDIMGDLVLCAREKFDTEIARGKNLNFNRLLVLKGFR